LNPLRVLIVGCGNIASVFDQGRSAGDLPLTHAGGYSRDAHFYVAACVEPNNNRLGAFLDAWQVPNGFHSIDEALDSGNEFDVISICSPTQYHVQDINKAMRFKPKVIFCEKPVTLSSLETEALVIECEKLGIQLAVNYTRRWDPDIIQLKGDMQVGRWGELRSVLGAYNKGILNNGSHMVDLLHLLVGPTAIVNVGKPTCDYFPDDPTVPVWLAGPQEVPVHLACGHAKDYAMFELQFVFSLGVLTMEEGGMFWRERRVIDSNTFKGYRMLDEGARRIGKYPNAMTQAIDNIYRTISLGEPLASTGVTALSTQRVCEEIKRQSFVQ
jgi:predicted dehydrogenase